MDEGRIRLGRWLGVEVTIDASWFIIAFLIAWSFYFLYDATFPDMPTAAALVLGGVTAMLFFASVLLHELSHSVMARRVGVPVEGITLFIFGGVTQTSGEATTPQDEFAIAVVGPLTSIAIAGVCWVLVNATGNLFPDEVLFALGHLGWLNLALGAFNMVPGFPLDGGRVLRSIVWRVTGSQDKGSRIATALGRGVASLLIAGGILIVFGGNLGGLWYAAIGWFLYQAATASGQHAVVKRLFEGLEASEVMSPRLVTLNDDTSLDEAVDDYFLRYDHTAFPVNDSDGQTLGILTLRGVRQIDRDQWPVRQVWSAMTKLEDACTVDASTPMNDVLQRLTETDDQRVLVVDDGRVVGIITPRDIARWVQRSEELGLDPLAVSGRRAWTHHWGMTTNDAERVLELGEAAEGVELFQSPGADLAVEKARDQAEASGWIPDREIDTSTEAGRLETIRDRRDALRVAMHSLETTVAGPASASGWREAVATALAAIREALEAHITVVEGPDGLLEEILEIAPRLAHEAEEIEVEHLDLLRALDRAANAVNDADSRAIRRAAMSLLAGLAIHRQRGSDLIYEAYSVDIGTGF